MKKSSSGIVKMSQKLRTLAFFSMIFSTTGCYMFHPINYDFDKEEPVVETPTCPNDGGPCITPPTSTNEPVDYTKTAANYREYGERNPRDERIGQTAFGSNMSASIPPTIDEEVGAYEEEIKTSETGEYAGGEESSDAGSNSDMDDPVKDWIAEEGKSLKVLLTEWSDESGWRLVWKTNRNYTLSAGAMFRGRFADVSAALVRAFGRARPAPIATFYKGNRVLVVETMEDENAYN